MIGIMVTCFSFIPSYLWSWYFSSFSCSFFVTLVSNGHATSTMKHLLSFYPPIAGLVCFNQFILLSPYYSFWLVVMPLLSSFTSSLLTQHPIYYYCHFILLSGFMLFLCTFEALSNYMYNRFIPLSTHSTRWGNIFFIYNFLYFYYYYYYCCCCYYYYYYIIIS